MNLKQTLRANLWGIFRYSSVGVLSVLGYLAANNLMFKLTSNAILSVSIGYIIAIPISYFGHILVTYQVIARHSSMSWRFVILTACNYLIAQLSTYILLLLSVQYSLISIISAVAPVPFSYILGKLWAFKGESRK